MKEQSKGNLQQSSSNYLSQRKVAHALLKMANNMKMLHHFVNKGGIDAVYKLCEESIDSEVLSLCAQCLASATSEGTFCKSLLDKQIMSVLISLIESAEDDVRYQCGKTTMLLTMQRDIEEKLVEKGILTAIQCLMVSRKETIMALAAICASNTAPFYTASTDFEIVVRLCTNVAKRLDVVNSSEAAYFVSSVFNNLTRIPS